MSLLLNIDTAQETATVSISKGDQLLCLRINEQKNDHAAWLHPAIDEILTETRKSMKDLDAVSVSIGPGSYTGLRIGLAAAKGFCYALNRPLICVNSLKILAAEALESVVDLVCPMIDARRMEVFAAVYDKNLMEKLQPLAMILHTNSFESLLARHRIVFCGDGAVKLKQILSNANASYHESGLTASNFAVLAYECFRKEQFSSLAYTEPLYIKEFQSSARK
jgi:tRNA threonylcarbamoyladenosine biosynthesis protein TsaB